MSVEKSFPRRRVVAVAIAILSSCCAWGGIDDMVLRFSTVGPDRYADGTIVGDGECYALVWSPEGSAFAGFNADGSPVSASDRVVLAGALAKDGRCRDAIFQIPRATYDELDGGEWAVCLVDTRTTAGIPAGVQDGRPLRVNRWGLVRSDVRTDVSAAGSLRLRAGAASRSEASAQVGVEGGLSGADAGAQARNAPIVAGNVSQVPASAPVPTVTAMEVQDGEVWLAVKGTVPYLSYTITSGSEPGGLGKDYFSQVVDGAAGAEIEIGTVKSDSRRFFGVARSGR